MVEDGRKKSPMRQIKKAIKGMSSLHQKMAMILFRINGKDNAMEFIEGIKERESWAARDSNARQS